MNEIIVSSYGIVTLRTFDEYGNDITLEFEERPEDGEWRNVSFGSTEDSVPDVATAIITEIFGHYRGDCEADRALCQAITDAIKGVVALNQTLTSHREMLIKASKKK